MGTIDFSWFGRPVAPLGAGMHPRDVFAALPRDRGYEYLRGPQDQVLDQWFSRRDERDLVVKLNTGGGKTIVGLLIAQCSLAEDAGPVAYLTPDRYLAEQVRQTAAELGIPTCDDPASFDFQSKQAILVDTFQTLVNGLSVFGVGGSVSKVPRYGIGTIVVDDAHACLTKAEDEFRLRLPAASAAYQQMLAMFEGTLEEQSPNALLDLRAGRTTALLQVPYWAWQDRQREVLSIIHPVTDGDQYKFTWPLIADVLPVCRAVFTSDGLDIAPDHLPVEVLTGFANATRRVYLTATLADDGILVTDFAADPSTIVSPVVPANAGDIGDRLILVPQEIIPDATEEDVRSLAVDLARYGSVR